MLSRAQVFEVIEKERQYQDATWPPHEGHAHSEHCLVLVDGYIKKAQAAWLTSQDETPVVQQLAKLAAIVVRALEKIEGSEVILNGLR